MRAAEWTSDDGTIALHNCPCEELLLSMPDDSVDLVVTSPPFNQLDQETGEYGLRADRIEGDKFLRKWNESGYDDDREEAEYQGWVARVVEQCVRVSRGLAWIDHKPRYRGEAVLPERFLPLPIRDMIVWDRLGSPAQNCGHWPPSFHLLLAFGRRGYWQRCAEAPGAVWADIPPATGRRHPCPMPIKLAMRLIRATCPPDGIVFDPFGGEGTVGRACQRLGRRAICCEQDERYFSWAVEECGAPLPVESRQRELLDVG